MAGVVATTHTFTSNEVVTSSSLNNIIDETTFTSDALANGTLSLTAGKLKVATFGITSNEMGVGAVTTNAIADGVVTNNKISPSASISLSKLANGALPTGITVTSGNIVNSSVTPEKISQPLTLATAQNSTSGTSIDFTGIPSWAKKITVMLSGVSTSGSSNLIVQVGDSGGIEITGYDSQCQFLGVSNAGAAIGFVVITGSSPSQVSKGIATLCLVDPSSNSWISSSLITGSSLGYIWPGTGRKSLSSTLDRVRITTINGTDTFDAGVINIIYE